MALTIIDQRIHDAVDRQAAAKRTGGVSAVSLPDGASTCAEPGFPSVSTTPSRLAIYRDPGSSGCGRRPRR